MVDIRKIEITLFNSIKEAKEELKGLGVFGTDLAIKLDSKIDTLEKILRLFDE